MIVVDAILKHSNMTSATAINATAYFYLPPYLEYKSIQSNVTHSGPVFREGVVEVQVNKEKQPLLTSKCLCKLAVAKLRK